MPSNQDREILSLASAAGLGAAAMYFLDPARGTRRRHLIHDKVVHTRHVVGEGVRTTKRDLQNRAIGVAARTRRRFADDRADDEVVAERVRAALGRAVSHPGAIDVAVEEGRAKLTGAVLDREAESLLRRVRSVRGVRAIEDRLERHENAEEVPGLQGPARRSESRFDLLQENWSPTARLLATVTGGALVLGGLAGRNRLGPTGGVLGLAGVALVARGLANEPLRKLTGIGGRRNGVRMRRSIEIASPTDVVFDYVTDWERWPEWMPNVHEVTRSRTPTIEGEPGARTHWEVAGPAGTTVAWDAVTTRFVENECVSWRSTEDAAIQHAGTLQLVPTGLESTRVQIDLSYHPIAGTAGHLVARIFGKDPLRQAEVALERLKGVVETGAAPNDGDPRPRRGLRIWSGPRKQEERLR